MTETRQAISAVYYKDWSTSSKEVQRFTGKFSVAPAPSDAVGAFELPVGHLLQRFVENGDKLYSEVEGVTAFLLESGARTEIKDGSWIAKDTEGKFFLANKATFPYPPAD